LKNARYIWISFGLLIGCWFWLVISFTAPKSAWWNSLWIGLALSAISLLASLKAVRSALGVIALIFAAITFSLLAILKFG
jgi:hypothetical protein